MSDQIEREQQIEEESLTKNSLQIQKAAWIREELEKRRAQIPGRYESACGRPRV